MQLRPDQSIILAQAELYSAQEELDALTTTANASRVTAMQNIATYEEAVRDAQYDLDNFTIPSNMKNMTEVEALNAMKTRLDEARIAFEPYKYLPSGNSTRQTSKEALDLAQADYNTAVRSLDLEYRLDIARANLEKAEQGGVEEK